MWNQPAVRMFVILGTMALSLKTASTQEPNLSGGTFSARTEPIMVPANAAGRPSRFMLDTGCSTTIVFQSLRHLLGPEKERVLNYAPNNEFKYSVRPLFAAPTIEFGPMRLLAGTPIFTTNDCAMLNSLRIKADGILGMDVLHPHVLQVNFDRGEWKILKEYYPTDDFQVRIFTQPPDHTPNCLLYIPQAGSFEFVIDTGNLLVESASLDSQTYQILEEKGVLKTIKPSRRHPRSLVRDGGVVEFKSAPVKRVGFLNQLATLGELPLPECAILEDEPNTLGLGFLSRFIVTFDFPKKMMYLRPGKQFSRRERLEISGILVANVRDRTKVLHVVPDSPGAAAGVLEGDFVNNVGKRFADEMSIWEIQKHLGELGSTVPLTLERRGKRLDVFVKIPDIKPPKIIDVDKIPGKKYLED
jgi:hypothetical protein